MPTDTYLLVIFRTRDELSAAIECAHGYTPESPEIAHLLDILCEFSPAQQQMFLVFLTGSPRLPIGMAIAHPHPLLSQIFFVSSRDSIFYDSGGAGGASDAVRAPCEYLAQPRVWPRLTYQVQGGARSTPMHYSNHGPMSSAHMHANIGRRAARRANTPP